MEVQIVNSMLDMNVYNYKYKRTGDSSSSAAATSVPFCGCNVTESKIEPQPLEHEEKSSSSSGGCGCCGGNMSEVEKAKKKEMAEEQLEKMMGIRMEDVDLNEYVYSAKIFARKAL